MSVLLLAIGTTRARAVNATAEFLLARDVQVDLVTVDPADWAREGLPDGVRVYALGEGEQRHPLARLGRLVRRVSGAAGRIYAKVYRLLRPYVMWRVARAGAVKQVDWSTVEQLVICDSHAIPIGWHLAKRHPKLTVGFELDRTPYAEQESAADQGSAAKRKPTAERASAAVADPEANALAAIPTAASITSSETSNPTTPTASPASPSSPSPVRPAGIDVDVDA